MRVALAALLARPVARPARLARGCACSAPPAEDWSTSEPPLLTALRARTAAEMPAAAHMCSGAAQGRFLFVLARLARASRVLEIGCFTGYASLWLAAALPEHGELLALERDGRSAAIAAEAAAAAGLSARLSLRVCDALEAVRALPPPPAAAPFDVVFIDADKKRYAQYYEALQARRLDTS